MSAIIEIMERIKQSEKVYVANSEIANVGRDVFAQCAFKDGDVIERCPGIEVPLDDPSNNDQGVLVNYYFYYGDGLALALGFGSIYNHSYEPNATYNPKPEEGYIEFRAIREITPNQEITVNYNFGNPTDKSQPNVHGVPPAA